MDNEEKISGCVPATKAGKITEITILQIGKASSLERTRLPPEVLEIEKKYCSACGNSLKCSSLNKATGERDEYLLTGIEITISLPEDIDGEQIREMKKQGYPWSINICWPCWLKSLGVKGVNGK